MEERERWMQAVKERLERLSTTHDLNPVLEEATLTEARELALTLTDDLDSLPARHLLGWLHWYRSQALPEGHGQQDYQTAITMFTACFVNGIGELPAPLLPSVADEAVPDAIHLLQLAQRSRDPALLSVTTGLWQRILAATPADHPNRAGRLTNLGMALRMRFQQTESLASLDEAIQAFSQAVQASPDDHPNRWMYLSNLGIALRMRFEQTGAHADLDNAIQAFRQAVQATSIDHPSRATRLSGLGDTLRMRFEHGGADADLDDATQAFTQAVQATPAGHPNRALYLSRVGNLRFIRFESTGTQAGLDDAIQAHQQAVQTCPAGHPDHAMYWSNLGMALRTRFESTAGQPDLDDTVRAFQQAVQASPADDPNRAMYLSSLGNALRMRFKQTGAQADLDNAIQAYRQALDTIPADHPEHTRILAEFGRLLARQYQRTGVQADLDNAIQALHHAVQATPADRPARPAILSSLGNALGLRFERTGRQTDLDDAIRAHQQAAQTVPTDDSDRAGIQSGLGSALKDRFECTGALTDLDDAVKAHQQAVQAVSAGHPDRAGILSNLGNALRSRFERTGTLTDLDDAVKAHEQAVRITPDDHPDLTMFLTNLGTDLASRFDRAGALGDLNDAINAHQQAVQTTRTGQPDRARYLSNLGSTLAARFKRTGALTDLSDAIHVLQEVVQLVPAGHPDRATHLYNLGAALLTQLEHTRDASDLDNAIQVLRQATRVTPTDHPSRARNLRGLGHALASRFTRTAADVDREDALDAFTQAADASASAASERIRAAGAAAWLTAKTDPGRAAGLLEAAILLLPEVAPRSLERGDQQHAIGRLAGLGADAAALALSDPGTPEPERPARALRLLEAARGLLLSQALSTRGDLSRLRELHPRLAERFIELRDWLDSPSPVVTPGPADSHSGNRADALGHAISDRRRATEEFGQLLAKIRGLDGFEAFALPPTAEQLLAQAERGPVVVLNVSSYRCDAILLTRSGITSQPLPGLDLDNAASQVSSFQQALRIIGTSWSEPERADAQDTILRVLAWLWDEIAGPTMQALGYHEPPGDTAPWPRLWWVPCGLLALLPVHAAGHHGSLPEHGHRTVIDRVISSYTPTVAALAHARGHRPAGGPGAATRSLIVAMPTTPDLPGGGKLRSVPDEAALLQDRLPHPTLLSEPLAADASSGQLPTRAAVLQHLLVCAIAHFACHGYADPADPSNSRLLLHDHRTNPLTIAALAPLSLDHAQLAYLSACSTALTSDDRLLDEAVNLATAFQLVGFPRVIGTLWEIDDAVAVEITDAFYAAIAGADGIPEPEHAAQALHHAVRIQRDRWPASPYLWASHIYAGA